MSRYLSPTSDLIFKKIFGHHPELLKSFLNAVLPLPSDCLIESLEYLPIESAPEIKGLKFSIVDVRCLDNHGRHFIVEMQLQWSDDFIQRMLFNTAATYVRQLKHKKECRTLSPVYGLALIDATFTDEKEWFHHYRMTSAHNDNKNLEDIQLVLIELPKLKPTNIKEKRLAILWLRFLKEINEQTETVDPSLLEVEAIKEALGLLEVSAYSDAELRAYDKNWDVIRSHNSLMSNSHSKGKAEGLVEGEAKGIQKGEAALLERLLKRRFAEAVTQKHLDRLEQADSEMLSRWSENFIDAKNIEAVFR